MIPRSKLGSTLLALGALTLGACGSDESSGPGAGAGTQESVAGPATATVVPVGVTPGTGVPDAPVGAPAQQASAAAAPGPAEPAPSLAASPGSSPDPGRAEPDDASGSGAAAQARPDPDPALQAAMPVAERPEAVLLADPADHLQEALATGTDASDTVAAWFCTTLRDGSYVDRERWQLWDDGLGRIGGDEVTWSAGDGALVLMSSNGTTTSYSDVSVYDRFVRADGLSARLGADRALECELSGPPRAVGLFADDSDPRPLTTEEITGEGIDELLVTGRSAGDTESFWNCTSSTSGVTVRSFELRLFDTGEAYSGAPGNWAALDRSTLLLSFEGDAGGSTLVWEDVVIPYRPDQAFDRFVALDANEVDVACSWGGSSRT